MLFKRRSDASQADAADADIEPRIALAENEGIHEAILKGNWTTRRVAVVDATLRKIEKNNNIKNLRVDLSGVGRIDTAGAWLIERLLTAMRARGLQPEVTGASNAANILLTAVHDATTREGESAPERRDNILIRALGAIGEAVYGILEDLIAALYILGATIRGAQMKIGRGHSVNVAAIVTQIDRMGVGAVPVIVLMSTIVGAIVAQQGAFQLRFFGAEIFVVDLVGILVLREMGVLLTAIMIAGRSGSAITAEIGSMKMREEVDALTVIGLNPVGVLVFPRLVALVIVLPCLTIIANFAALAGAIAIAYYYSNIAPAAFIDRLRAAIDLSTFLAGLIKAPFMALVIGIIGSVEGLKVGGSAESLGLHVTASVVKSIFIVILLDGFFAIFYAQIGF
ncbi:ABC transporter permease [Mesorhizobium sp. BAC0120]|uniref:ABC transporter permease n=1 Tax=Mesorhizobium sp. BAC0120 TaxID=3090670 RepID=UPI00298C5ABA|nr:ABC transporter permease [Mesorhizobium sp. BAC0120]MDW6026451.1 ABC transporter permease [Mesorhizobium sp. BAC0120]